MERKIFLYLPKKAKATEIVEKLTKESKIFTEFYCVVRRTTINACLHRVLIHPLISPANSSFFSFFFTISQPAFPSVHPSFNQSELRSDSHYNSVFSGECVHVCVSVRGKCCLSI